MSNFHCCSGNVSLETQFYSSLQFGSNSLFSSGNDAFLPCAKFVEKLSNRFFGVQIESDSCTHIGCFLYVQYSTEWSWITKGINTTCFLRCRPSILYFAQTFTHHCVNNVVRQSKWHSLWTVKGFSLENNDKFKKKLYMFILKIKDWIIDDKWLVTIILRKAQTFQCTL